MKQESNIVREGEMMREESKPVASVTTTGAGSAGLEAYEPYLKAFVEGDADPAATAPEKTAQMLGKMGGSGSFSWCTLLFAPVYWGWRRCYWEAAAYTCCILLMLPIVALTGMGALMTALQIGAGFAFYPLYRRRAMQAYRQAYAAHDADGEAMLAAMRGAGGTSWKGLWLTLGCYLVAVFLESFLVVGLVGIF